MSTFGTAPSDNLVAKTDMERTKLVGLVSTGLLIGIFGVWSASTIIGGAVVASGETVMEGATQQVQSLDGGIIDTIAVQDGDFVEQGDVLLTLDATLVQVNLDITLNRLSSALALRARLEAEQSGQTDLVFHYPDLPFELPDVTTHEAGQREIFNARAAVRLGRRDQLGETLAQISNQQRGVQGQMTATQTQLTLIEQDLENTERLARQGLARQAQVSELQRSAAGMQGQLASFEAEIARLSNTARDVEIETLQSERGFMEGVVTELREVTALTEELTLEIVTRSAQLDRVAIYAPATGFVHEMQAGTLGGVVNPGETILQVIPSRGAMEFELRVNPSDIDQVYPGQPAQVVMGAFDPQNTPKLNAEVRSVSPDVVTDPQTGQTFYRVGLAVPQTEIAQLEDARLVPGMPIDAFLETGDRTVLAYLLNPITSHLDRAFRE